MLHFYFCIYPIMCSAPKAYPSKSIKLNPFIHSLPLPTPFPLIITILIIYVCFYLVCSFFMCLSTSFYAATAENSIESSTNKNRTTIWPSYSTSRYLSKEHENTNWKWFRHSYVHHYTIFTTAKIWKQPKYPSTWIDK